MVVNGTISLIKDREKRLKDKCFLFPRQRIFKSIIRMLFSYPKIQSFIPNQNNLYLWYKKMLTSKASKNGLYIVAGEMKFAFNKDLVALFKEALDKGKPISIICGPEIAHDVSNKNKPNPILSLLEEEKHKDLIHIYLLPKEIERPSHFAIAGNNVFVEEFHLPDAKPGEIKAKAFSNSVLWLDLLSGRFQDLLETDGIEKLTSPIIPRKKKVTISVQEKDGVE